MGEKNGINIVVAIAVIMLVSVAALFISNWFFGGLHNSEDSPYEIEQTMPVGVSESYSQAVICETDEFVIKELTPEVFSVFAKEESHTYNDYGYMEALDNAMIVIGNNYEIEGETALTSYHSPGSETRHLHVKVSPKNASANNS